MSRLKLMADANKISTKDAAANILATVFGKIDARHPRGDDQILVKITRVPAKKTAKYVERPD